MILIVDSGSSKTLWKAIGSDKRIQLESEGYNPYYMDEHRIAKSILNCLSGSFNFDEVSKIFYYGAGCSSEKKAVVNSALKSVFNYSEVTVESDLLAAARALLGSKKGFAAILGTGTNSWYYDGKEIVDSVDSLGFLAGDEGSGSYLGKMIIRAFVRDYLPQDLKQAFKNQFNLSKDKLIEELYSSTTPNKYCANFAQFAGHHHSHPFIKTLVKQSFYDFFDGIVSKYEKYKGGEIAFVGSIAFFFTDELKEVASEFEMSLGEILKNPMDGLVNYHLELASLKS